MSTKMTELAFVPAMTVTISANRIGARQVRSRSAVTMSPINHGSAHQGVRMTDVLPM